MPTDRKGRFLALGLLAIALAGVYLLVVSPLLDLYAQRTTAIENRRMLLPRLHAAADSGESAGVEYAAHALHGLVANFGADAAALAAQRVQEIGHAGDLTTVAEAVATLEYEIRRLETTLVQESGGDGPGNRPRESV